MSITKQDLKHRLEAGDIQGIFVKLGWNRSSGKRPLKLAERDIVEAELVAEKKDFFVAVVKTTDPTDKARRQRIEKQFTKFHAEHLIVYIDGLGGQVWQLAVRRPQQPIGYHEVPWHKGQQPELLYEKLTGLFVALDEEDSITVIDVTDRARRQFEANTKKVVKKFYKEFGVQHKAFVKFIKGIAGTADQQWYASLMLNRLMFIYFIQRKGFLSSDGKGPDTDYLRTKLNESKTRRGDNKFYKGFYREFLLELFHKGLGDADHKQLKKEIGRVPYLNGGLFDEHHLEQDNDIQIEDKAFEKLFDFFGQWQWTLDIRPEVAGNEINPDVIGYIFEQYINERAEMGAYYTQEDITNYIAKNTIIPWLFEKAKEKDAQAFKPEGGIWGLLRDDPDKYIYKSVRHGISAEMRKALDTELVLIPGPSPKTKGAMQPWWQSSLFADLPAEVRKGLNPDQKDLWKIRKAWNTKAPESIALPTEIYREVIERRRRYLEVRQKLTSPPTPLQRRGEPDPQGCICSINDLITFNLDIQQFVQDVLREHESGDLVWAFYDAIAGKERAITVLDPTCGSGAFLFAALNILKPLYAVCLERMAEFRQQAVAEGKTQRYKQFQPILDNIAEHHANNRDYFILKSIILRNLYGVDLMREAVEIAKLRLFLKLVSTIEPDYQLDNLGIEPLPDIDFNIRPGNTLVGFATKAEVKGISAWSLDFDTEEQDAIEEQCDLVDKAFEHYKAIQLGHGEDYNTFRAAKDELQQRLGTLRDELDGYLAKSYGITDRQRQAKPFAKWAESHAPFHWFAEYYGIVHKHGGFDVIIGNPPYVEYSVSKAKYTLKEYATLASGNLYAYVTERSHRLLNSTSLLGLIVPMSITSIRDLSSLRSYVNKHLGQTWLTNHAIRPQSLFTGVAQRVSILIANPSTKNPVSYYTKYLRVKESFNTLFQNLEFASVNQLPAVDGLAPKLGSMLDKSIWSKLQSIKLSPVVMMPTVTTHSLFVKDYGETYWIFPFSFKPYLTPVKSYKELYFNTRAERDALFVASNSTLFYWYYTAISDCWHFGKWHLSNFPYVAGANDELVAMAPHLKKSLVDHRITRFDERIGGNLYEYKVNKSKPLLDEIDALLGAHYGLSEEELDHVISYDIKYRMGEELEGSDN